MPAIRPDLPPPTFAAPDAYGRRLTDTAYWAPYAAAVLRRHGRPADGLSAGFAGTYPTLLAGDVVVKLFGWFPGWDESYAAERAANELVTELGIAPRVLATGRIFDGPEPWPYLVVERLRGTAWRDAELDGPRRYAVAAATGRALRRVHGVVGVSEGLLPDWIATDGRRAAERHDRWGSLPGQLISQVDSYLADYVPTAATLVHADVTEDHVYVTAAGDLEGIIDWGDAMRTDAYYELGALHFGCFGADRSLLQAFLDGYGWERDSDFARHAMQVALMHRFDLFTGVRAVAARAASLADLAAELFAPDGRVTRPSV